MADGHWIEYVCGGDVKLEHPIVPEVTTAKPPLRFTFSVFSVRRWSPRNVKWRR